MAGARDAALRALIAFRRDGAWPESALKDVLRGMDRREAALATRLCNGVLQNRMLLDHWLSGFVRGKLQPVVRDILRLAAYQLCFLDRIPPSAAVNEAVEQTRRLANQQAARLVNGVLRNLLRAMPLALPDDLSLRYSHPEPIVRLFLAQFGREETERILQTDNEAPQTVLQVNPLRGNAAALLEELPGAQPHPWLPGCLTVSGPVEQTAAFREGRVYVQDAAAHLAVAVSGIEPGMRVLDCCAAPGGKSFAAALQMQDRGTLYSCDIHPHRLDLIERGAERLGVSILETHLQDASQPVPAWRGAMDVVLADVPCSGLALSGKSRISAITSPRRSCPPCSAPFLRSRRNMSAPAACCSTAPARSCAGKTRLWRRTSCARIRTSSRKTRRGQRAPASRRERWSRCFRGSMRQTASLSANSGGNLERHQIHDAGGAGDRAESAR